MHLREASSGDEAAIDRLIADAFAGGEAELEIVAAIRNRQIAIPGLELVAVNGAELIGHVLVSAADVDGHTVPAVAPVSVCTDRQRTGVGSALMREVISRADEHGWPLIALLGHESYYPRFGFEPGRPLGIVYPPVDTPAFMVRRLAAYDARLRGTFRFGWE